MSESHSQFLSNIGTIPPHSRKYGNASCQRQFKSEETCAKRCQHDRQYSFAKEKKKERYIEDNYDATHDLRNKQQF